MDYWAYARVSTKKQAQGHTIEDQTRPLAKFLAKHYHSQNAIRKHLYHEQYTGTRMSRPVFNKMLKHVKPYDEIVFYRLSRMSRTVDGADDFIKNFCVPNHVQVYILKDNYYLDPNTSLGFLQIHMFLSFIQFDHDTVIERMNEGKLRAKQNGQSNWNGGINPRFIGKHKDHYLAIYHYAKNHTLAQTAKIFNTSSRTVERIRHDGRIYTKNKHDYLKNYINNGKNGSEKSDLKKNNQK